MSTLKFELNKNDFLMDKVNKKLFFVVSIDLHNVIIREEVDSNEAPVKKMPKHMINLSMIKVKKDVMQILFGDKKGNVKPEDIPDIAVTETTADE
jgi:hypothetical protein